MLLLPCCLYFDDSFHSYAFAAQIGEPLPILSGPVTVLPWDNEEAFMKAKYANNTNKLIAAYKRVLLDPLVGEEYNVLLAAKLITTTGGGICKVATTLYNVAVLSNLPILERHYHNMPVSYTPYGQDATVSYGSYDFRFKNDTSSQILIWAQGIDDTLYIGFYGNYTPPKIEWLHETLDVNKTTAIYVKNKKLEPGSLRTVVHGMDGKKVKSSVKITYPDGTQKTKSMGISRYKPLPYVIEMGP